MKIERYIDGKKVTLDQLKKHSFNNRVIDRTIERVSRREDENV
ncbi:MAG: hypothetical protein Q8882_07920 [Bacillota bacterium]|nr:hypothetical protein [Bacillota bacterium]